MPNRPLFRNILPVFVVGFIFGIAACDLTTESPDFSVTPSFEVPLVTSQSFVLVGPDSTQRIPLVDTTKAEWDSLLSVRAGDQSVVLTKNVALFEGRSLARLFPSFRVEPGSLSASAAQLLPKNVGTSFGTSIGVQTRPAVNTPLLPVERRSDSFFAVAPDAVSVSSDSPLLDPTADLIEAFTLSRDMQGVNRYRFVLQNGLHVPLISATRSGQAPPELVVEAPSGAEIARGAFSRVPAPGEQAEARISVAGQRLPRPLQFRLDATTPRGIGPLAARPQAVQVATSASPFRITETTLRRIPPQSPTSVPLPTASVEAGSGVQGVVVRGGTVTLTLQNSLPYPLTLTELSFSNAEPVGDFPAGATFLNAGPIRVPARTTLQKEIDIGRTAIASRFVPEAVVEGEEVEGPVHVRASDGVDVGVDFSFDLETLYLKPDGQEVSGRGRFAMRSSAIRFDAPGDHVTLERGTLTFRMIRNQLPSGIDPLQLGFPTFLTPPFTSSDSLVVQFGGEGATAGFPPIPPAGVVQDESLDLSGVRFEFPASTVPFHGSARLSPDSEVQAFSASDRVAVDASLRDLRLQGVQADVAPQSALLPSDTDGNQALDLADDAEAQVFDASGLHQIGGTEITALDLEDTRIRSAISTNIGADAVLYLAVLGRRSDGREAFLAGRGPYSVSETDTTAKRLQRRGEPIAPEKLLLLPFSGSPSPEEVVTRVLRLTPETATLQRFLRLLPEEMRVAGVLVVQPDGGRVQMRKPIGFRLRFRLAQPFQVGGDVAFTQTLDADLEALGALTSSEEAASVQQLGLKIPYESELPLATALRLEVLGEQGDVLARIPSAGADSASFQLRSAPVSRHGTSVGSRAGTIELKQSRAQLERLSQGHALRLEVRLSSPPERDAVLRATDGFSLRLEGAADLQVRSAN